MEKIQHEGNAAEAVHECCMRKNHESNNKMQKYLLVIMVGIVLLMSVVQSFQINAFKSINPKNLNQVSSNAAGTGSVDVSGWTEDEKMMYEHHGVLPERLQSNPQSSNMVGGC